MNQLSRAIFSSNTKKINLPVYNPDEHASGIVHIGIGAFHKAHQAVYTDDVLNKHGGNWRITAVSLRNPTARDQLIQQDNLYTVVQKSDALVEHRIIGAIEKVLVAPENPSAVIELLANPSIKIVTITITEKGYCHLNGNLDLSHPEILQDLNNPTMPSTMAGFIVAACELRMQRQMPGITVISCDNLAHNGVITRSVIVEFAKQRDQALATWIDKNLGFCSTMVDRIVPATTEQDIRILQDYLGVEDQATVICEPFRQWVIEDNFCTERPRWDDVGVMIVDDVTCYENMKLRLLNGSHSTLAYIGFLSGYQYIHQAIVDPELHFFIERLMDVEITPTLSTPKGFNIEIYKKTIRARLANSFIPYKTLQVAKDGSQKLPHRLSTVAADLLNKNQHPELVSFIIAAWVRFLSGVDEAGNLFDISDPNATKLSILAKTVYTTQVQRHNLLDILGFIFSHELMENEPLIDSITFWLTEINRKGIKNSVKNCLLKLHFCT